MRAEDLAEDPYFVYQSLGPLARGMDGLVAVATFSSGID